MANEILQQTNNVSVVEDAKPLFNGDAGEKVIRISIKCRLMKTKDGKKTFNSIKGLKHLRVIDDEGVDIGKHNRWLDLHFTQDALKTDKQETRNFEDINDLKTGYLYVKAKFIDSPKTYRTKVDDETGEVQYPQIWVKGGIVGFEPLVAEQDEFDYVEPESVKAIEVATEPVEMDVKAE